jgi:hypothetical protein
MEKEIKVDTNKKKFFRQFVEILQPINRVRAREAEVLAELLYQSYLRRDIGDLKDRFKLVFDYDTKIKIQEELKMTTAVFRNCCTQLRKKGIIGKDNVIQQGYLINPPDKDYVTIKFVFKIND